MRVLSRLSPSEKRSVRQVSWLPDPPPSGSFPDAQPVSRSTRVQWIAPEASPVTVAGAARDFHPLPLADECKERRRRGTIAPSRRRCNLCIECGHARPGLHARPRPQAPRGLSRGRPRPGQDGGPDHRDLPAALAGPRRARHAARPRDVGRDRARAPSRPRRLRPALGDAAPFRRKADAAHRRRRSPSSPPARPTPRWPKRRGARSSTSASPPCSCRTSGVAGLLRLLSRLEEIERADVVIGVAGMEGSLFSVLGGLVGRPIIAVPTSRGYGAAFQGLASLLSAVNSCANGVSAVNIDSGYAAAMAAYRILSGGPRRWDRKEKAPRTPPTSTSTPRRSASTAGARRRSSAARRRR